MFAANFLMVSGLIILSFSCYLHPYCEALGLDIVVLPVTANIERYEWVSINALPHCA